MKTLERAAQLTRERRDHATTAYEQLVRDLAAGNEIQPERVVEVAEAANVPIDQVEEHVSKLEQLATAKAQLAELPRLEARLAEIGHERERLTAELSALQQKVRVRDEQLHNELNSLTAARGRIDDAQRLIQSGAFDLPAEAARRAEASRLVSQHGVAASNSRGERDAARRKADAIRSRIELAQKGKATEAPDVLAELKNQLRAAELKQAQAERDLAPHDQAIEQARQIFSELN